MTCKKLLVGLIIVMMLSLVFPINNIVFASSTTYTQSLKSGIDNFPEEYKSILNQIKNLHPNWNFEAYYTGLDWNTVVLNETSTHGRNRIIKSSNDSYKCSCGDVASGYACASEGIIKYYLDPRNFLNEVNIFQFLEISYNENIYSIDGINSIVKNTFLDNSVTYKIFEEEKVKNEETGEEETKEVEKEYTKTYAEIIMEAAQKSNMSPYSVVTKIIQEVGSNGSASVSGTYEGYVGYYNFFNLGAYDTGNAIVNGLKYAQKKGWNNQYVAIIEGTQEIAKSYTNAGQNTAYFYKWDVVGTSILKAGNTQEVSSSDMFWHQYMTNVQDPTSQSKTLYNTYAKNNILDKNLNFIIPIYNNMPTENLLPTELTADDGDLYYVNCTSGLMLRSEPSTSSSKLGTLYKDTTVIMLEKECAEANGYKWDKIKLSSGVIGYVADKYLTFKCNSSKEEEQSDDNTKEDQNQEKTVESPVDNDYCKYENTNIIIVPGATLNNIDESAEGELKTGAELNVKGQKYIAVVKGDVNGDGEVKATDYMRIKNYIMESTTLTDAQKKAADVNGDGEVKATDYMKIKNYIMGTSQIDI